MTDHSTAALSLPPANDKRHERLANWSVRLIQVFFVCIMLLDLDGPFVSAHNERQNESFDMARHVYRDGWSSVITPKVSYVYPGYEQRRYMAVLLDFPFHGLIAWPFTYLTTHDRALMRLISTAFSLAAIRLLYWILRQWLSPGVSAFGTALWATAPMVLHFGQVPMPDIVCTTGMLAAFWFALRAHLPASSACFLFSILAKVSVIVFGLPILTTLLITRRCRTPVEIVRIVLAWGWFPLLGLVLWMTSMHSFAPPTPMSVESVLNDRGQWHTLMTPLFYKRLLGSLFPFGIGVLGAIGLVFSGQGVPRKMDGRIKGAIIASNIIFVLFIYRKVPEPQYTIPLLAWLTLIAGFGFELLRVALHGGLFWRTLLGATLLTHIFIAVAFTADLKSSRVPNLPDVEAAAKLLPPDDRVLVLYRFYGAGPAIWLDQNVLAMGTMQSLEDWPRFRREGFSHLLALDIESLHNVRNGDDPLVWLSRIFKSSGASLTTTDADLGTYTDTQGPFRKYCDQHFTPIFSAPHAILYSLPETAERK